MQRDLGMFRHPFSGGSLPSLFLFGRYYSCYYIVPGHCGDSLLCLKYFLSLCMQVGL